MKKRITILVIVVYIITMFMAELNFIDSGKSYARDPDAPMGPRKWNTTRRANRRANTAAICDMGL